MRMNLSIAQKGIILVLLPLLFELVFAAGLFVLEQRAEEIAAEEQRSKEIVSQINELIKLSYDSGSSAAMYGFTKSEILRERYHKLIKQVPGELKKLEDLVAYDPEMRAECVKLAARLEEGMVVIYRVIAAIERGQSTELLQGTALKEQGKRTSKAFMEQAAHMVDLENQRRQAMPVPEAKARQLFKVCLLCGIVINLLIAILLAVFFSKDIKNRLALLVGNTTLLKEGKELEPVLPGKDEIAHLDHVFHDMAIAIANARKADQEAFERVRSMVQSMPIGLLAIDTAGVICAVNPRAEEMFGYGASELIGLDIRLLFPECGNNGDANVFKNLTGKIVGAGLPLEALKKSGTKFPTELSLTEYKTIDGDRLLATVIDITERQRIEQLRKEFVTMVSHDLKSPLTSINASLALIVQGVYGELSDKGLRVASDAEHETVRLITLIGDLLDLARMDAGKLEIHSETTSLDSVFDQSLRAVASLAEQKNISIDVSNGGLSVKGDSDRLVQVIVNLLSNALRYSPTGSTIKVGAEKVDGFAEIRVSDRGPGIPVHLKKTIFERFEQVDVLNASLKGAAGLGLSICRAIIEAHEGQLGVDSEEGAGSTFWFRVPLSGK